MDYSKQINHNLNIIQWNARSLKNKWTSFVQLLNQEKIHIAAISETWLDQEFNLSVSNYVSYRLDRDLPYGGVMLLIHNSIRSERIKLSSTHLNSKIEIVSVKIYNCGIIENIFSLYCSNENNINRADWDDWFSLSNSKTLILGDFNAHHTNWSYKIDTRGNQLFQSSLDNNFCILNDGSPTRFQLVEGNLRETSPHISFVSSDISLDFNWQVTNESLGSDNLIIKLTTNIWTELFIKKKRNFKNADWNSYTENAQKIFSQLRCPEDPQLAYSAFVNSINDAAVLSIPYTKTYHTIESKFKAKPYWNAELSKSVAIRRIRLSTFRRNPTPDNLELLTAAVAESQRLIRIAKKRGWHTLCDSINENTSASEMWRRMKWIKGRRNSIPSPPNIDKIQNLLYNICPDFVSPRKHEFKVVNSKIESEITLVEMESCIKSKDTAPGCDDISYSMIKKLPQNGKLFLLHLFNWFLFIGFVPTQWRDVHVIPIPKPGRNPHCSSSLRPISLLSCICKIFHSIINKMN